MQVNAYFDNIQSEIILALQEAKNSIKVAMYYFTNDAILNTLTALAKKGVKIELILFDENNDFQLNKYIKLIELDSKIYLYLTESSDRIKMHHKFCIIDDRTVITGSYNWTINAKTNRENVVIIEDCNDCTSKFIKEFNYIKPLSKLFGNNPTTTDTANALLKPQTITSGYLELDGIIHNFDKGNVILIGGASSMGKTSLLLNMAHNMSKSGGKMAFFALSETKAKLIEKLLSIESGISSHAIRNHLTQNQEAKTEEMVLALDRFFQLKIQIVDILDTQILSIIEKIKAIKMKNDVDVFFIDYLELITGAFHAEKNYDFHTNIISKLKLIARQLNIVIIITLGLNRKKNEFYNRQKPIISDLAFNIENYADSIFLLYRPEYYDICDFEDGHSTKGVIEVIVAKNKHGKHGNIRLMFKPEYGKILNFGDASFEVNPISINSRMNSMDSDYDFSRSPLDFDIGLNPSAKPDDGYSPF